MTNMLSNAAEEFTIQKRVINDTLPKHMSGF